MNSLSWLIYLAETLGKLGGVSAAVMAVSSLALAAAVVQRIIVGVVASRGTTGCSDWQIREKESAQNFLPTSKMLFRLAGVTCVLSAFLYIAMPSRGTVYAIAASQVGEQIATSEAVRGLASDATKALQQWIKKQIEPESAAKN